MPGNQGNGTAQSNKDSRRALQLELFYLSGASLVEVGPYAQQCGMAKISDAGFMGRFKKSGERFRWMTKQSVPEAIIHYKKPRELEAYRILGIDASDVRTQGAAPKTWRLHYALELFTLRCSQFQVTEEEIGERRQNFTLQKKDLILADRAYATIQGIEYCQEQEADFILRIRNKHPCLVQQGTTINESVSAIADCNIGVG